MNEESIIATIVIILSALVLVNGSLTGYSIVEVEWAGNGTMEDPYRISNCVELQNMSNDLEAYYILTNNIDCSGTSTWNPDDDEFYGFEPIGEEEEDLFEGEFNGKGYSITGLYINRTEHYQSLFGNVGDGIIQNVNIIGAIVRGDSDIGVLAGKIYSGEIINASATGNVSSEDSRVGGLVGTVTDAASVYNSYAIADVKGGDSVGGLIGALEEGMVNNSYSMGSVNGSDSYTGGLIGLTATNSDVTVSNCFAMVEVYGEGEGVGGLIGKNGEDSESDVYNSYATGNVIGTENYVGGLIGENIEGDINSSYATGNVTVGDEYVGGLIGSHDSGFIKYSFSTGYILGPYGENIRGFVGDKDDTISGNYWLNRTDNITKCGAGPYGCTVIEPNNESYFYDISNAPLSNWSFPPWDDFCDDNGFPSLEHENKNSLSQCKGFIIQSSTSSTPEPSTRKSTKQRKTVKLSNNPSFTFREGGKVDFKHKGKSHKLKINNVDDNKVSLTIKSKVITVKLFIGETQLVDLDRDGINDISITLEKIVKKKASIKIEMIKEDVSPIIEQPAPIIPQPVREIIPEPERNIVVPEPVKETVTEVPKTAKKKEVPLQLIWGAIIIITIGLITLIALNKVISAGNHEKRLHKFVKKAKKQGYSKEHLRRELSKIGWPTHLLDKVFRK